MARLIKSILLLYNPVGTKHYAVTWRGMHEALGLDVTAFLIGRMERSNE